jgi:hypothetical protein
MLRKLYKLTRSSLDKFGIYAAAASVSARSAPQLINRAIWRPFVGRRPLASAVKVHISRALKAMPQTTYSGRVGFTPYSRWRTTRLFYRVPFGSAFIIK